VKIPEVYQGITLNEQQKKELSEGKAVYLDNMKNNRGEAYSGNIQYNADRRYFAKVSDFSQKQYQTQSQTQSREPGDVQKTFRGRDLTADQRNNFREDKTVQIRFYPKVAKCPDEKCGLVVFCSVSETA
jgi:hypothetical protein